MDKETLIEKISRGIMQVSMSKKNIDMEFLVKKVGFKIKKIEEKGILKGVIGNEGKVFDSIVAVSNGPEKIIVLYRKKDEKPLFVLLNTIENEDFNKEIEKINNGKIKELKNKSMELNYVLDKAFSALGS